MRETAARITTLDPEARLAVLLATTGVTQVDLAKLLGVAGRTVRRWMEGACTPPAVAIKELEMLARTLDEDSDFVVRAMGEQGSSSHRRFAPSLLKTMSERSLGLACRHQRRAVSLPFGPTRHFWPSMKVRQE